MELEINNKNVYVTSDIHNDATGFKELMIWKSSMYRENNWVEDVEMKEFERIEIEKGYEDSPMILSISMGRDDYEDLQHSQVNGHAF